MELELLGLADLQNRIGSVKGGSFPLNYDGLLELKEIIAGSELWSRTGGGLESKRYFKKNKPSFEDAIGEIIGDTIQSSHLMIGSGQPNEEDDRNGEEDTNSSCNKNDGEDVVVGWPPIKSWRKKEFHQNQVGRTMNHRLGMITLTESRVRDYSVPELGVKIK